MAVALPDLTAIAILLLALAIVALAIAIVDLINWFIQNTVGRVPGVGHLIEYPVDQAYQYVSNALGGAAADVQSYIGWCFHNMVATVEWLGREIAGYGLLGLVLAEDLARIHVGQDAHTITNEVTHTATVIEHETVTDVRTVDRVADVGATAAIATLTARVGTLEHDIADVYNPALDELRARAREIEDGFQRAWELLQEHAEALGIGAVTSAVAVALGELGASWISCEGAGAAGSLFCGLGAEAVEGLLGTVLALAAAADPCATLSGLTALAESGPAQGALDFVATTAGNLLSCAGAEKPLPITITLYPPGPVTALGAPGVVGV